MTLAELFQSTAIQGNSKQTNSHQVTDLEEIASKGWNMKVRESMITTLVLVTQDGRLMEIKQM